MSLHEVVIPKRWLCTMGLRRMEYLLETGNITFEQYSKYTRGNRRGKLIEINLGLPIIENGVGSFICSCGERIIANMNDDSEHEILDTAILMLNDGTYEHCRVSSEKKNEGEKIYEGK